MTGPYEEGAQTLYADPDAVDPLVGRVLAVGRSMVSDTGETGLHYVQDGDPIHVQGRDGHILQRDGLWVAAWSLPPPPDGCPCDQEGFVAARGLSREEVLAAARVAIVHGPRPALPEEVTAGLRPLGTANGIGEAIPWSGSRPQELTVRLGPGEDVHLWVRTGDVRLLPHSRLWAPGGRSVERRERSVVQRWRGDTLVWATAPPDVSVERLERLIASLIPATESDVAATIDEIAGSAPLDPCPLGSDVPDAGATYLRGVLAGTRWIVGVHQRGETLETCQAILPRAGFTPGGSTSGTAPPPDLAASVEVLSVATSAPGDGSTYLTVVGHVEARATRVEVRVGSLPPTVAQRAAAGPGGGHLWFATAVDITSRQPADEGIDVVALDEAGVEVGRVHRGSL